VPIETFQWTAHALLRLDQRQLTREDIEQAIREHHDERRANAGQADWLVAGTTHLGIRFEAIYDHPVHRDDGAARVVSAWRV